MMRSGSMEAPTWGDGSPGARSEMSSRTASARSFGVESGLPHAREAGGSQIAAGIDNVPAGHDQEAIAMTTTTRVSPGRIGIRLCAGTCAGTCRTRV